MTTMDMFNSLRIWLRKRFRKTLFINLRSPVVLSPYSSYDSSNIPKYEIYSWKMVIYDHKITAIILYIGSTLGNIYCKYA